MLFPDDDQTVTVASRLNSRFEKRYKRFIPIPTWSLFMATRKSPPSDTQPPADAAAARKRPAAKAKTAKPAPAAPRKPVPATSRKAKPEASPAPAKKPAAAGSKLVRDSFTMPQADFALVAQLKARALDFKRPTKKSELLRAGLQALSRLDNPALQAALESLTPLKTGRPKKGG